MSKSKKDKFLSLVGGQTDDVGSDQKLKVLDSIIGDSRDSDSAKDADKDDGNRNDTSGSNDKTASKVGAENNAVTGEEVEDTGAGTAETQASTGEIVDVSDRADAGDSESSHKLITTSITTVTDGEKIGDATSENTDMIAKNIVDDGTKPNSTSNDGIRNESGVRDNDDDVSTNITETKSEISVADKGDTGDGAHDVARSEDAVGTISGDVVSSGVENSDDSAAGDDTHTVSGITDEVVSTLINNAVEIIRGQNEGSVNPETAEAIYGPLLHRKKYTERHERVTWYIEKELLAEVKILNKMGVNKSQILNDALRLYLRVLAGSNQGTPKTTPSQTAKRGGKKNR